MKHQCVCAVALLIAVSLISCGDIGEPVDYLTGEYAYTGYDLSGNPVVSGTLTLRRNDGSVGGRKELVGELSESGTGNIHGEMFESGMVRIFLSPSPGVVYIEGNIANGIIEGKRFFVLDKPPIPQRVGTFKAIRITPN